MRIRTRALGGLTAALTLAAVVLAGDPALAARVSPNSVTCVPQSHTGDNWASGYCINGGALIAYQEHVRCTNGHTYDGNIVQSTSGNPESRANCNGANNFLVSGTITHT